MRYAKMSSGQGRPFLLNRSMPAVAGPEKPFKKAEQLAEPSAMVNAMDDKSALKAQYGEPKIGAGAVKEPLPSQANPVDEATKPLEVINPGAMTQIDPSIQKQSDQMATQMRGLVETKDQSIMSGYLKANLDFVNKLKEKHREARDVMQDPALAEKYKNMMDDHLAMNDTLQGIVGPGVMERMVMS